MSLSRILEHISNFIKVIFHPGYASGPYTRSFIWRVCSFISTHPLILFFVLSSFLFIGIRLIRRMIT